MSRYSPAILGAGSLISLSLATMLARFAINKIRQKEIRVYKEQLQKRVVMLKGYFFC